MSQDQVSAEPVEWGPDEVSVLSDGEGEPESMCSMSLIVRRWCLEATRSTRGSKKKSIECCWTVRLRYSPVGLKALLGGQSGGIGWASNHCSPSVKLVSNMRGFQSVSEVVVFSLPSYYLHH